MARNTWVLLLSVGLDHDSSLTILLLQQLRCDSGPAERRYGHNHELTGFGVLAKVNEPLPQKL
jgi:hypothetical protein